MATAAWARTHAGARWSTLAVVVAAGIVAAIQAGKAAGAAPQLQDGLGLDLAASGWLTGVFALLGLAGGVAAGALVARAGDRRVLLAGLAALVLGSALGALAPGYAMLLAARVVEGMGFLLISVAGPAILDRLAGPAQRSLAFACWSCFMPAGMALIMLAGPYFSDWRVLWWSNAGLAALAVVAVLASIPAASVRDAFAPARADARAVLANQDALRLSACFALYNLMFFAVFQFLPVLLMERMAVAHHRAGLLSALATAANLAGNLAAGWLLARGTRKKTLLVAACLLMGLAGVGVFTQLFAPGAAFLLCVLFCAVGGLIPATLISSAPLVGCSGGATPVVLGLLMQGCSLGQVLGPVAVGAAIQALGWTAAAGIVLAAALLACLCAHRLRFETGPKRIFL